MPRRLTDEQARERFREVLGDFYDLSKLRWNGSKEPVTVICPLHGEWYPTPNNVLYGKQTGCFGCNKREYTEEDKWLALEGKMRCRDCKEIKEANGDNFPVRLDWFRLQCRACLAALETQRRVDKNEEIREKDRIRWADRRDQQLVRLKTYYRQRQADPEHAEAERKRNRDRAKRDVGKWRAIVARRRARKLQATPRWLSSKQNRAMRDLYVLATELTRTTGIEYNVDHIVPLVNDEVCGLHVPWNLQILTAKENKSKGSRFTEQEALAPARKPPALPTG